MNKGIELLAPVGSWEALEAAVMNGADAVYLGGKLFNARQYASNFSNEELIEAVSYAHLRKTKVFVTVNILLDDTEVEDALNYSRFLYEIGVDAVIVQDIGLSSLLRKALPDLELHASTQMTINNLHGAKHLEGLGFKRAVLAREIDAEEIKYIADNSNLELEVFVHGALCYSYSGQCLMSSLIGGRSGNRGTCAQPCRMAYSIIDDKDNQLKNWDKEHFLSTRDLNTIDQVEDLIKLGIKSFKIEGRMKRPEYVAAVTGIYRKAINDGINSIKPADKDEVTQIFNRGFTKGMTFGDFGSNFVNIDRPDNRGVQVGIVNDSGRKGTSILFDKKIVKGDGLEWVSQNNETDGLKAQRDVEAGEVLFLQRITNAKAGSPVNRTSSIELLEKSRHSYKTNFINFAIEMEADIKIGRPPMLVAKYGQHKVKILGETDVQSAINASLTINKVEEQLSKLGDTVFKIEDLNIDLDDNAFLPVREINELRRKAVEELEKLILKKPDVITDESFERSKKEAMSLKKSKVINSLLSVRVSSQRQLEQLDLNKVDRVYIGFYDSIKDNLEHLKGSDAEIYLWTDRILYEKNLDTIGTIIENNLHNIDGISVSNLGSLEYFKRFGKKLHGDFGLNPFNSYSFKYLEEKGLSSITLSPELNLKQMSSITEKLGGVKEAIVYGYLPSMISRNCPMAVVKGCSDDSGCHECRFAHGFKLKDRMGKEFSMERGEGYTTIYNAMPLMVPESIKVINEKNISMLRLDFTIEDEIREVQSLYYDYLNGNIDRVEVDRFMSKFKLKNEITNGHFFRGVLER